MGYNPQESLENTINTVGTLLYTNSSLAGKSTTLMVLTRKDGDFHGRTVSFRDPIDQVRLKSIY